MKRIIVSALGIVALAVLVLTLGARLHSHNTRLPDAPPAILAAVPPPTKPTPSPTAAAIPPAPATNFAAAASVSPLSTPPAKPFGLVSFTDFSSWVSRFTNGAASLADGEQLAKQRQAAMLALIQTDPAQAIQLSAPYAWRQELPPEITRYFESQIDGRGDFNVAMGTDFANGNSTTYRYAQFGDQVYQAYAYGRRLTQISQQGIPLHGVALDGKMAVSSDPMRVLTLAEATALDKSAVKPADAICSVSGLSVNVRSQPVYAENGGGVICFCGTDHYNLAVRHLALAESGGDTSTNGVPITGDDAWTHGNKSLLYMRVNFPDDLTEPISMSDAYAVMDGVNTYYTENSYDLASFTTTVTPLVTLPQTKAYYASNDPYYLLADARTAAKAAGYDTANYDRDIVALTSVPGFSWGGLGYVGGKGVWVQSFGVGVTAHELGHNFGLLHANFWNTLTNVSGIGPGANLEYGNIYDTMGSGGVAQFNSCHKKALDWLKADAVQSISTNGVYRIYPLDVPASKRVDGRNYAGVVRKDALRYYWMEFRQQYTSNPWLENGVLLEWSPWPNSNGGAQMVDTTPGSPNPNDNSSREDAAVVVGRTFNDNAAGVHITTLQRGATGTDPWLDVQVNIGAFTNNQPPVLGVEVDQTNVAPGALVHFHATATDPDGDTLAYAWTFDGVAFATNNLPWTSWSWTNSGNHVVRCVVSDMKGGEASANMLVTVGTPNGFNLTGQITDSNGVPIEGVLVGNGSLSTSDFAGGYTDSNGRYLITGVTSNLTLQATLFGYTFTAATNWSNPLAPTNDQAGLDFSALPMTAVNLTADTNSIPESDTSIHYFTLTRTGDTNNDLAVQVYVSGSALLGSAYTLNPAPDTNNVLIIPAGTNSITLAFQANNGAFSGGSETATLTVVDDTNAASPAYVLAPLAEAGITIVSGTQPNPPQVSLITTTPEISESGIDYGQLIFTRSGDVTGDLTVYYTASGTATNGVDYVSLPGVAVIPAGQGSVVIPVVTMDDKKVGTSSTLTVTLTANAGYNVASSAKKATITILDDDFMTVTVSTTKNAADPATAGTFTVEREGDLTQALVVNYNASGSATPGADYTALSGTVTIPAGQASTTVNVTPIEDPAVYGNQTVTLILTNTLNYEVGTPGSATMTIQDDKLPLVSIKATTPTVSQQGDTTGEFTITRTGTGTSGDLTVYLAISGTAVAGFDYAPIDTPVVIPDGSASTTVEVIPFQNLILDSSEDVELSILTATNYNVASAATADVTITGDTSNTGVAVGFAFASSAFPESLSPGITVTLSTTSSVPVSVDYRVIGGTAASNRYTLAPGTLTISNGWTGVIPLQIANKAAVEPAQTVRVVLVNPVNASLGAIKIHTYTILPDDGAQVSVSATVTNATDASPGHFVISRTGATNASQPVLFQITGSASAPTDYSPLGNSVTIPAGALSVDLPVLPNTNRTMKLPGSVVLTLISATNGSLASPSAAAVTIVPNYTNNLPVLTVSSTNQPYAVEGGGTGQFVFTRTGPVTNALLVPFTLAGTARNGTDYVAITNGVTIPAGQSNATVTITAVDDQIVEGERTVILSLTEGNTFQTVFPSSATVTIQDNDQRVWIDASDFTAAKPGTDTGQFTFTRFGTTNTAVTIYYTISGTATNGVDYAFLTNFIVIPAGSLTNTLTVLPLEDGVVEGPRTVTLTLQTNAVYQLGTPTNGTVTIMDDQPMLYITSIVTNVLEGGSTNGIFRLTRLGDPKYDFTAYVALGGTAVYGVDYAAIATNIYFSCGVTSIDMQITTTNDGIMQGDETVTATLLPNPTYTILSPSNAVLTVTDAGTNLTPVVTITNPTSYVVFLTGTNTGLELDATVADNSPTNTLTWSEVTGPPDYSFSSTNTATTFVTFTNPGAYLLRLTADTGLLQGHADVLVFVSADQLAATNMLLHWAFDDGSGTNAVDTSGSGRDGTLIGNPAWVTNGAIAGALSFPGTGDNVTQTAGSNVLNGLNAFTVALWVKPVNPADDRGILSGDNVDTNLTFAIATHTSATCGNNTNVVEVTLPTTTGVIHRISASNALLPGQWQHVAVTWTNGQAPQLYINGQLDQPLSGLVAATGVVTNCPQFIAGLGGIETPASWNGALDDVRVYARVLDAGEILALADAPVTNHAPVVYAGPDVAVQIGVPVTLTGTVTDDGLPNPPGQVTFFWSYLGTNTGVVIPNPLSLTNTFVFSTPGDYTFQLTANDGAISSFSDVTVTVLEPTSISVTADIPDAYELGPVPGDFTLTRTGDTNELVVNLAFSGTSSNGFDFVGLTNVVVFPAGSNTLTMQVMPYLDYEIEGDASVILTVVTNIAYSVSGGPATVIIHDSPYGLWSIQNFSLEQLTHPEMSGAAGDFSHDGIPNFTKYAFNLNPLAVNPNPAFQYAFETDTNTGLKYFGVTYTRRLPPTDVAYGVFISSDLLNWYTGTNYINELSATPDANGFTETVHARTLAPYSATNNLFLQIEVWLQQVPVPSP